jgi:hypothetical protein
MNDYPVVELKDLRTGWYWHMSLEDCEPEWQIARIDGRGGSAAVDSGNSQYVLEAKHCGGEWRGPIPMPTTPDLKTIRAERRRKDRERNIAAKQAELDNLKAGR